MRQKSKVDGNQPEIVNAFRKMGASVCHLHTIGKGVPDILVGISKQNYLIEIKDGSLSPSKRQLTDDEKTFHESWRGNVTIISTVQEAIDFLNNRTSKIHGLTEQDKLENKLGL